MSKYYGAIGYSHDVEEVDENGEKNGIIKQVFTEVHYKGEILRNTRRWENGVGQNDNLTINNSIRIIADEYAYQNCHAIVYAEWMGRKWKVTNVEIQRPGLVLTIGGVFNLG